MENNAADILLTERRQKTQAQNTTQDIRQYRGVYRTRLVLRILSLATCISIIAVLIDSIRSYHRTKHVTNPYRNGSGAFPVWPDTLKMYPSYMLLGAALAAGLFSLILIIGSFHKSVRRMTKTGNTTTIIVSGTCLVVWVVVAAYYGSWDTKKTNWDLFSWTCRHQDPAYNYQNIEFHEMCTEMRFAFWAGVGLAALEASNLLLFVIWWLGTRRSRGYSKVHEGKDSSDPSYISGADIGGRFS